MVRRLADARRLAVEVSLQPWEANEAPYDQAAKSLPPFEQGSLVLRKVEGNRGRLGDR